MKPKVVVVGGGMAGADLAHNAALCKLADVTLVDTKDYFEVSWATLRPLVEPPFADRITWKHVDHLKGRAKLVVGTLKLVEEKQVTLDDGTVVPYDYLVLAPGNAGGLGKPVGAPTLEARRAQFRSDAAKLEKASSVLIVGGGPVGIELAGEILTDFKSKKVTIVHSGSGLMAGAVAGGTLKPAVGAALQARLAKMGCSFVFDDRVVKNGDGSFGSTTVGGKDVSHDIAYDCTGSRPATGFALAPGGLPALKLDAGGYIVVNKDLSVPGAPRVFALGDAAATGDIKQGYVAATQVKLVAANIAAAVAGKPGKPLKNSPTDVMLVSLGRGNGVASFPGGALFQGCLPTMIKSGGLFVSTVRSAHGV